ncbi:MAG TPA: deoxyribodipyrimidine photo-lyase [bacterium]|nr:deoxyribodipyrimidine photo-lyase [bacterium]
MTPLEKLADDVRVTVRRGGAPDPDGTCVLYWMQRAQRAEDNAALDLAVRAGNELGLPVVAFLGPVPFFPNANRRHFAFLAQGVPDIAYGLERRGVGFVFRPYPQHSLETLCEELRPALVIGDENPLREPERWRRVAAERLRVPLWTVDTEPVVPSVLLEKEQYAARTIRPRIHRHLAAYLVEPARVRAHHPWKPPRGLVRRDPREDWLAGFPTENVPEVGWAKGGSTAAHAALRAFLRDRLRGYAERRNRPDLDATSRLSPWLHFGHIAPLRVALEVAHADAPKADRDAFLEEHIVRRELSINFVRFNPRYDSLDGCERWARATLEKHRRDRRDPAYGERALENAATHDPIWNAAQRELVTTGYMHGFLRMYWAKQILFWSKTPEEAFAIAVRQNDRWLLDGRDPNGYAGIAWAIGGKHDRAWGERPVFGKIRSMTLASTLRKFDVASYERRVAR